MSGRKEERVKARKGEERQGKERKGKKKKGKEKTSEERREVTFSHYREDYVCRSKG